MLDIVETRAHSNKEGFTVSTVGGPWQMRELCTEIHWFTDWFGVALGEYEVTRDNDPSWSATLIVAMGENNHLRLVNVMMRGENLWSTAIPVKTLLSACMRAGTVYK